MCLPLLMPLDTVVEEGFADDELAIARENFVRAVDRCGASAIELRHKKVACGSTVEYLVRREADENDFMEIRYVATWLH